MMVLAALERNHGNQYITAKKAGISQSTLSKWVKEQQEGKLLPPAHWELPLDDDAALDERLEQVARQMVAAMPEKVEEANLQELARSLMIVLDSMNQTRAGKEKSSHAREKLAEILERYAVAGSAAGTPETTDGGGSG